jgi:hypothetical protein
MDGSNLLQYLFPSSLSLYLLGDMLSINPSSISTGKRIFSMYWSGHATMLNPPCLRWSWLNGLLISSTTNSKVSIPVFLLRYLYFSHARGMNISLNFCISVDMSLVCFCRHLSLEFGFRLAV